MDTANLNAEVIVRIMINVQMIVIFVGVVYVEPVLQLPHLRLRQQQHPPAMMINIL